MSEPDTALSIGFHLNGEAHIASAPAHRVLVDYLREECRLTGTRIGCSRGVCGACTVLVDERPVAACSMFVFQVEGAQVQTIEGLASTETLQPVMHPIQQAFIDHAAFQCGYCTGGMILLAKALLAHDPHPTRETIIDWVSSNICRCTGYAQILDAIEDAARRIAGSQQESEMKAEKKDSKP